MTPIERALHLKVYWNRIRDERREEYNEACKQFEHWSQELVKAEIAEKLANEKS